MQQRRSFLGNVEKIDIKVIHQERMTFLTRARLWRFFLLRNDRNCVYEAEVFTAYVDCVQFFLSDDKINAARKIKMTRTCPVIFILSWYSRGRTA